MNGRILIGAGVAVLAWGGAAIAYGEGVTGVALVLAAAALLVLGVRMAGKKDREP